MSFKVPEKYRIRTGVMQSHSINGNNGQFNITSLRLKQPILCQASDGFGWEHVSASIHNRCPTWDEMCIIKDLFWDETDCVIQFHPARNDYINNHKYCLHLWRPINHEIMTPPNILVGIKGGVR